MSARTAVLSIGRQVEGFVFLTIAIVVKLVTQFRSSWIDVTIIVIAIRRDAFTFAVLVAIDINTRITASDIGNTEGDHVPIYIGWNTAVAFATLNSATAARAALGSADDYTSIGSCSTVTILTTTEALDLSFCNADKDRVGSRIRDGGANPAGGAVTVSAATLTAHSRAVRTGHTIALGTVVR